MKTKIYPSVFTLLTILLFSSTMIAQEKPVWSNPTAKGHFIINGNIGGNLDFSSSNLKLNGVKQSETNQTSFLTDFSIGYTILDNFEVGLGFGFHTSKTSSEYPNPEYNDDNTSTSTSFEEAVLVYI